MRRALSPVQTCRLKMRGAPLLFLLLFVLMTGCHSPGKEMREVASVSAIAGHYGADCPVTRPTGITRPSSMCGEAGYAYLSTMWIRPQCGGCHFENSPIHWNRMGDANPATGAYFARFYQKEFFVERAKANPFLLDECLLVEGDPLLADIRTWYDHPENADCAN